MNLNSNNQNNKLHNKIFQMAQYLAQKTDLLVNNQILDLFLDLKIDLLDLKIGLLDLKISLLALKIDLTVPKIDKMCLKIFQLCNSQCLAQLNDQQDLIKSHLIGFQNNLLENINHNLRKNEKLQITKLLLDQSKDREIGNQRNSFLNHL